MKTIKFIFLVFKVALKITIVQKKQKQLKNIKPKNYCKLSIRR